MKRDGIHSILILIHCESNAGYAIKTLEAAFFRMAMRLCGDDASRVHFGYPSMAKGKPAALPADFDNFLIIDTQSRDEDTRARVVDYLRRHRINTIFGFDQPVVRPLYESLRRAGVEHFISYWGAPMSSVSPWPKRLLKRVEVALRRYSPDHYVFESAGMAETAVLGRGIPASRTSVAYLGVDTQRYRPDSDDAAYARVTFGIPADRRIFYYAGHMEARKGVAVIMSAANQLAESRRTDDWHFLLFGNRPGEELPFIDSLSPVARERVTFGGYRDDLPRVQRGCHAGIIASTGWDSLTMSSMEIQSSGMPLLVSSLPGLRESVADGETGFVFKAGDASELCRRIVQLLDEPALRDRMGAAARQRVEKKFSAEVQIATLFDIVSKVAGRASH